VTGKGPRHRGGRRAAAVGGGREARRRRFSREVWPERRVMREAGIWKRSARYLQRALLAAPSTGGAHRRIFREVPWSPWTAFLAARGQRWTVR
jgi:hypothetical protein